MNSNFGQVWPTYFQVQQVCMPQQMTFPQPVYSFVPVQALFPSVPCVDESSSKMLRKEKTTELSEDDPSDSGGESSSKQYQPRRKPQRLQKSPKKKLKMKPERNALTNIGNQILTFIYLRKKNHEIIKSCFPQLTADELRLYYAFAKEIKQSMYGYINYDKLTLLWHSNGVRGEQSLNYRILRTLSLYYIREVLVRSILTSRKMPTEVKPLHLRVRRKMLAFLSSTR